MRDFYHESQTQPAEEALRTLHEIVPDAVILGDWAVFLYSQGQKSTDVDIAVDYAQLGRLKSEFGTALTKTTHLSKYVLELNKVGVDVLVMRLSDSGVPIEDCLEPIHSLAGFRVVSPEGLLALKLCAWMDRKATPKGEKDEADVIALLMSMDMDWTRYGEIAAKATRRYADGLPGAIHRLLGDAEIRQSWRYVKTHGSFPVKSPKGWSTVKKALLKKLPAPV